MSPSALQLAKFESTGMVVIYDQTLTADTASFDVQNIPAGYRHLKLVLKARSSRAATTDDNVSMRFNNDSGSNYDTQYVQFFGSTTATNEYLGQTQFGADGQPSLAAVPAATAPSGAASQVCIEIVDYAGAWRKTFTAFAALPFTDSANGNRLWLSNGEWRSTSAIDRIQIYPVNGPNFVAGSRLTIYGYGGNLITGGADFSAYALIRDEKTANTNGGDFTSGSWQTRVLNTESFDPDGIVSISSNQFTLQAGTYFIDAYAPAWNCGRHKLKIANITDATDSIIGASVASATAASVATAAFVRGRITISGSKAFELQHRCETTATSAGLGVASNFSVIEVYAEVMIWKQAA